jgi:hypothetical protein
MLENIMRNTFLLMTLFFSVLISCDNVSPLMSEQSYNVILIIGQSNTHYGIGFDPVLDAPMSEIKQLGRFRNENMRVIDATEPLHHHTRQENKIGLGLAYAKLMHKYLKDNKEILIIPSAYAGTGFQNNGWNQGNDLYEDAVKRVKHVISTNPENKLVSILWHQGENDVGNSNYQKYLDDFIVNIRNDLEAETVPFILGGMVPYWVRQRDSRKNQQMIISSSTERHDYIGYADPESPFVIQKNNNNVDQIHYDAKGQRELANRYFEQFVKIIEK